MAKDKNQRLIKGKIRDLDEETRKRAVELTGGYYIIYPMELDKNMFKLKEELTNEKTSTQIAERDAAKADLKKEETENDFALRNKTTNKFVVKGTSVLSKDWRMFSTGASPEMTWVRTTLAALNNILDENIKQYVNEQGIFDSKSYLEKVNTAYDEFFEAAQNYLDSRDPSSPPGKRRKDQVASLLNNAKKQKVDINNMVDAIKDGALDFSEMKKNKAEEYEALNSLTLVNELTSREADGEVEWQNEGNSTDVYKLQLVDEKGQNYYLKENLPFLNDNLEGFLKRRLRQLDVSQQNKANPGPDKPVEERVKDLENADFDYGKKLLANLSTAIDKASEAEKGRLSERFAGYFAHNFDEIFKDLEENNRMARFVPKEADLTIDELIEKAKNDKDAMMEEALKMRRNRMKEDGTYDKNAKAKDVLTEMTAAEWLTKKMNLDPKKDKVFLDSLKGMSSAQVETLFRVTMGKEVELFGQMSAKKIQNGEDKAAINNTATSRIAENLGFTDVITKSKTALVKFKRRDGTTVNQLCTISEEAPGRELIDLMKEAERTGKKLIYSPEAMRNLMRLQAIDTLCLQKDRHGRNFKCDTDIDKKTGNIIIKSIKAYDNDMSLDALTLAEAFAPDPETGEVKKNQFLPSMTTKIKKGSALYKHILGTYCGVDMVSPYKLPETPVINWGSYKQEMRGGAISTSIALTWSNKNHQIDSLMDFTTRHNMELYDKNFKVNPNVSEAEKKKMVEEGKKDGSLKYMKAYLEDNPSLDEQCKAYAIGKFVKLSNEIKKIWTRSKEDQDKYVEQYKADYKAKHPEAKALPTPSYFDRAIRTDLNDEEKLKLNNLFDEMDKLNKQFNWDALKHQFDTGNTSTPFCDIFMKSSSFLFKVAYGDSPEMRMLRDAKDYDALKSLMNNDGDLELPTLLHYDKEAKDQLEARVKDYEDPNSQAYMKLREVGLSKEKIEALAKREREMLNNLVEAEKKALQFYKAAGWTKPPQNRFYLEKSDYKELNGLSDLAVDPGNTYLAVDNENYLVGQTFNMNVGGKLQPVKYTQLMNEKEIEQAKIYKQYIFEDKKRWKYSDQEKQRGMNKFDVANTSDTSASAENSAEYIRCCMNDKLYEISHGVIADEATLTTKLKDAIFLSGLQNSIKEADVGGLSRESLKKLMEPGSDGRKRFEESLRSPEGTLFMNELSSKVSKMFSTMNFKKLNEAKFTAVTDLCVEGVMNKYFSQIKNDNNIDQVLKDIKKMEDFGKNIGSTVKAEEALDKYAKANPGRISAERLEQIKNKLRAKNAKKVVQNENNKQVGEAAKEKLKTSFKI
ncbi:hypothetical protein SAMN02910369_00717 [Lachnospiraceae bacterium NE2001]|nr:hypothetical protein SAMN02910369_00717 [Lachnospiraceae bacterium NE2001]